MRRPPEPPEPTLSVYVQPTPHGLWTGNNNFGFEVPFRPEANNRQQIVKLPEWGEPAVWTISLGIDYSDAEWPLAYARGFEVIGEINYGSGGATETVLVDWIQGTTLSVPMNALTINAFYRILGSPEGSTIQPDDLVLRVVLGRGCFAGSIAPTKYAELVDGSPFATLVDNGESVRARIPKFARDLFLAPLRTSDYAALATGNNWVRFFSAPDAISSFSVGSARITENLLLDGIRVPPFAKYVAIENIGGGSAGALVTLNFELQL
ncbi:MAG: hypothetical protein ACOY0T_31125 [Myxococcota bacterium]